MTPEERASATDRARGERQAYWCEESLSRGCRFFAAAASRSRAEQRDPCTTTTWFARQKRPGREFRGEPTNEVLIGERRIEPPLAQPYRLPSGTCHQLRSPGPASQAGRTWNAAFGPALQICAIAVVGTVVARGLMVSRRS